MPALVCPDCSGPVSPAAKACPKCGRPTTTPAATQRPPLLTKPAGVFVQLLGLVFLIPSVLLLAGKPVLGLFVFGAAIALFWLGRQTKPRTR